MHSVASLLISVYNPKTELLCCCGFVFTLQDGTWLNSVMVNQARALMSPVSDVQKTLMIGITISSIFVTVKSFFLVCPLKEICCILSSVFQLEFVLMIVLDDYCC